MTKRAVITGGAGFVGSHLCERLLRADYRVVCVDNLLTGSHANISHLTGDDRFEFVLADVTAGFDVSGPVDAVLHLACPASPKDYLRLPAETLRVGSYGTFAALELASVHGARFLLASTSEVYGSPQVHPQVEHYWGNVNPIGPRSVYDEAKRYAETATAMYRREYGVNTAIARIFNTYGPRMRPDDGRLVPTFVGQALEGAPLTVAGDGSQTRSLCYVDDLVEGLYLLMASDQAGPVNLGNPHELTVLDTAQLILRLTGSSASLTFVPLPQDDPLLRRPDIGLAERVLGWTPKTPVEVGMRWTVDWFAERMACSRPLSWTHDVSLGS